MKHTPQSIEKLRMGVSGDNSSTSKLSSNDVLKIVDMFKSGKYTQVYLANLYNVSENSISKILSGYSWGSITGIEYNKG